MTFGLQSLVSGSLPGATEGLINEALLPVGEFVYSSTLDSSVGNVFTFTTGFTVPSGDVVCYINGAGSGNIYADSFTVTTAPAPTQPLTATTSPTNAAVVAGSTVTFTVTVNGVSYPRLRSISMSQVFDAGYWLPAAELARLC